MKHLRAIADKVKTFFICLSQVELKFVWKLTLQSAFPIGLEPIALLLSPLTIPFCFVLRLYQQYLVCKVIYSLKKLTSLVDTVLAAAKPKEELNSSNVPG